MKNIVSMIGVTEAVRGLVDYLRFWNKSGRIKESEARIAESEATEREAEAQVAARKALAQARQEEASAAKAQIEAAKELLSLLRDNGIDTSQIDPTKLSGPLARLLPYVEDGTIIDARVLGEPPGLTAED